MHIQKTLYGTLLGTLLCACLSAITMQRSKTLEQTTTTHQNRALVSPLPLLQRENATNTGSFKEIIIELVYHRNYLCIKQLLSDMPADKRTQSINEKDPYGLTPLMLACSAINASTMMAELLISCGAHVQLTDARGHNAYSLAVAAGNADIARFIYEKLQQISANNAQ